jgi:uncharacterized membrane protein (UPF0127 family)
VSDSRFGGLPHRELSGGLTVIEASTLRSRLRGVGGLASLADGLGLELPTSSIHTYTVRFALDLIWRAGDGRVLRIDRDVPRWRIRACRGAKTVIEVSAGNADAFLAALTS